MAPARLENWSTRQVPRDERACFDRPRQSSRCARVLQKGEGSRDQPDPGYEAYVAPGSRFEKDAASSKEAAYHLTLLAQNKIGFRNLVKLASKASLEGFYFKPRIDKEILAEFSEGIICLSGCVSSEFSRAILNGSDTDKSIQDAIEVAQWFEKLSATASSLK